LERNYFIPNICVGHAYISIDRLPVREEFLSFPRRMIADPILIPNPTMERSDVTGSASRNPSINTSASMGFSGQRNVEQRARPANEALAPESHSESGNGRRWLEEVKCGAVKNKQDTRNKPRSYSVQISRNRIGKLGKICNIAWRRNFVACVE